ncbi:hypothetical protein M0804_014470 [Polistes exclamans]|nr:hypothetical protein M0804_014470 [Polistes exclamans]
MAARLALQEARANTITNLTANAKNVHSMDLSTAVDARELLRTAWSKFDAEHDRIVSSSRETALEQSYFKENCYDTTMQTYLGGVTLLNLRIEELSRQVPPVISQSSSRSRTVLPHISLPKFSGNFSDWRPFEELFSAMIKDNPDLSQVEKLHYLRTSLVGEAAKIIANLKLSADSFTIAWNRFHVFIFELDINGTLKDINIDRLKPAYLSKTDAENDAQPTVINQIPEHHWTATTNRPTKTYVLTPEYTNEEVNNYLLNRNQNDFQIMNVSRIQLTKADASKIFFLTQLTSHSKTAVPPHQDKILTTSISANKRRFDLILLSSTIFKDTALKKQSGLTLRIYLKTNGYIQKPYQIKTNNVWTDCPEDTGSYRVMPNILMS